MDFDWAGAGAGAFGGGITTGGNPLGIIGGGAAGGFGGGAAETEANKFKIPRIKLGATEQNAFNNVLFGPQNIDPNGLNQGMGSVNPNSLIGGQGALSNYMNSQSNSGGGAPAPGSMLQGGGQQTVPAGGSLANRAGGGIQQGPQGFDAGQTFSQMFNDPNVTMNYGGQQGGGGYTNETPSEQANRLNPQYQQQKQEEWNRNAPMLNGLLNQQGGGQNFREMVGGGQQDSSGGIPGLQDIVNNPYFANGQHRDELVNIVKSLKSVQNSNVSGIPSSGIPNANPNKNAAENQQDLRNLGLEQGKIQMAMQSGGYNQLGNAFGMANTFAGGLGDTVGNINDLTGMSLGQNQGNVGDLRNAVNQGQGNFDNYFQQNLSNVSGNFDQARDAMSGASPMIGQAAGIGGQNAQMGQGISSGAMSDTNYMRQLLNEDRAQRDSQMNAAQGFNVNSGLSNMANDIYNANITSGQIGLSTGPQGEQFRQAQQDAGDALAARGLGRTSSAYSDAAGRIQMQKDAMNQQLVQGELARRSQTAIEGANLNKQLAMQGAGLTNQSSVAFAGNLPALYNSASTGLNASTAAGGLVNDAAQSQIQMARGFGDIGAQQANAANQGAQTMLQGNQLTQQGLNNVGNMSNQGNQIGLNALSQAGNLEAQGQQNAINQGQLGLATQGQGSDQAMAQLNAIMSRFNDKQKLAVLNAFTQNGAGGSV